VKVIIFKAKLIYSEYCNVSEFCESGADEYDYFW